MENKINIGEIIRVGAVLFAITAVLAALLAFVNGKTAPLIEQNALKKEQEALSAVMPDAAEFEEAVFPIESSFGGGVKNYKALDADKNVIGVCVITETTGYDVGIQTVTGVDKNLTVTGVEIISMKETPGLGAKASEESFRSQYIGKSGTVGVSKSGASSTEIQAISGATKTSNGVTDGVNIALNTAKILIGGGNE